MNTIDTPRADDATHEQISDIEAIDQTQVQQMKAKKSKSVEDQTIAINEDKVIEELPQTNNDDAKVVQKSPKAHYQQSVSEETCCERHKYTLPLFIFGSVCCIGIIVLIVIVIVLNAQTATQNQVSYKQGNFLASSNSEFETIKIKQLFDPPNWQGRYKPFSSKEEYKNQCSARPVYEEEFIFITDDEFQQILSRMSDREINKMDAQCKISRDKVIQEWQIQEQILSIDRDCQQRVSQRTNQKNLIERVRTWNKFSERKGYQ